MLIYRITISAKEVGTNCENILAKDFRFDEMEAEEYLKEKKEYLAAITDSLKYFCDIHYKIEKLEIN